MKIKRMGRTGLQVSEICLGTMTFGNQCDEPTSHAIMDKALDGGVTFFDTADAYPLGATSEMVGRTEKYIGSWLSKGKREQIVLAAKFSTSVVPTIPPGCWPNHCGPATSSAWHVLIAFSHATISYSCAGYFGHPFRKLACCARLNRFPCETGEMRVQSTRFILLALVFQRVYFHEGEVHSCCLCSPQSSNASVTVFTCSKNVCCVGSNHQRPRLCSERSPISPEGKPNCWRKTRCCGNN